MAWRHRIAFVLLFGLTALPASAVACALACEWSATETASHHPTKTKCEEPQRSSSDSRLSDQAVRDCGTHGTSVQQVTTTPAVRADLSFKSLPSIIDQSPSLGDFVMPSEGGRSFDYIGPPGAPPTARPAILRV